jgi:hypothetical protein
MVPADFFVWVVIKIAVFIENLPFSTVQAPILLVKATLDGMPDDSSIFDWSPFTTNQVRTVDITASHSDILWRSETLPIFAQALLRYLGNA